MILTHKNKNNLKTSFYCTILAASALLAACGEAKDPKTNKTGKVDAPVNKPVDETQGKSKEESSSKNPNVNSSNQLKECASIQTIKAHMDIAASADLTASDTSRFCLHTVTSKTENITGQPLDHGLTIANGLKLLFADVSRTDHGVTFAKARTICESLTIDGGGFSLPKLTSIPEEKDSSIEAIAAYIKHSNKWDQSIRFWVDGSGLEDGMAYVNVPLTGGITSVYNWTGDALLCVKK